MNDDVAEKITNEKDRIAEEVTQLLFADQPDLENRYGPSGRAKCTKDTAYHLGYLAEAIRVGSPVIFNDYVEWAEVMLSSRHIPVDDLIRNLTYLERVLTNRLGREVSSLQMYLQGARKQLKSEKSEPVRWISRNRPFGEEASQYLEHLLDGDRAEAARVIDRLVDQGVSVQDIYEYIFQVSQYEIGALWQQNEISVAHEHFCTAATQTIMARLYPLIFSTQSNGKTMIGCAVSGELHELGIRMVTDFFEMDGWDTYYLGANMPAREIVNTVADKKADLLAISVTIPVRVHLARELIAAIRDNERTRSVKVLTGGYPFLRVSNLWKQVGADGSASSAREAVEKGNQLSLSVGGETV